MQWYKNAEVHILQQLGTVFAKFLRLSVSPYLLKMERRVKAWLAVGFPSRCKDQLIKVEEMHPKISQKNNFCISSICQRLCMLQSKTMEEQVKEFYDYYKANQSCCHADVLDKTDNSSSWRFWRASVQILGGPSAISLLIILHFHSAFFQPSHERAK